MAAVRWTQRARDDLRDIHDFIARDSPRAAEALVERLLTATERLAVFPESGRVVPEFPDVKTAACPLFCIAIGRATAVHARDGRDQLDGVPRVGAAENHYGSFAHRHA